MFVHPAQVAEVVKRHPEIIKARLVVARAGDADVMTLACEVEAGRTGDAALTQAIADSLQSVTKQKGMAELCGPGALANDGKVIEDARSYD